LTVKTLFAQSLSDDIATDKVITRELAEQLFHYFKNCKTFRWSDANNDCEDRATNGKYPMQKAGSLVAIFLKKLATSRIFGYIM
jgi:hypothetical protein